MTIMSEIKMITIMIIIIMVVIMREPILSQLQAKVFRECPYCAVKTIYSSFIICKYRAILFGQEALCWISAS